MLVYISQGTNVCIRAGKGGSCFLFEGGKNLGYEIRKSLYLKKKKNDKVAEQHLFALIRVASFCLTQFKDRNKILLPCLLSRVLEVQFSVATSLLHSSCFSTTVVNLPWDTSGTVDLRSIHSPRAMITPWVCMTAPIQTEGSKAVNMSFGCHRVPDDGMYLRWHCYFRCIQTVALSWHF